MATTQPKNIPIRKTANNTLDLLLGKQQPSEEKPQDEPEHFCYPPNNTFRTVITNDPATMQAISATITPTPVLFGANEHAIPIASQKT